MTTGSTSFTGDRDLVQMMWGVITFALFLAALSALPTATAIVDHSSIHLATTTPATISCLLIALVIWRFVVRPMAGRVVVQVGDDQMLFTHTRKPVHQSLPSDHIGAVVCRTVANPPQFVALSKIHAIEVFTPEGTCVASWDTNWLTDNGKRLLEVLEEHGYQAAIYDDRMRSFERCVPETSPLWETLTPLPRIND